MSSTCSKILCFCLLAVAFGFGQNNKIDINTQTKSNLLSSRAQGNFVVDTGAANAYAVTLSPSPTSYTSGLFVRFKAANANTGASTLAVGTLGATPIKKKNGAALVTGDINAGDIVMVQYDGANFQFLNSGSSVGTLFYQTVDNAGTALAQQPSLNMTGTGVSCVNNAGANRTDCTITSGTGTANPAQAHAVTFSSTPTFTPTSSTTDTVDVFIMTLTGNVTSSTLGTPTNGQDLAFIISQDATGGRTFVWPTAMTGQVCPISPVASTLTEAVFHVDNAGVARMTSCRNEETPSIVHYTNTRAAPLASQCTGLGAAGGCDWPDATKNNVRHMDGAGNIYGDVLEGVDIIPETGHIQAKYRTRTCEFGLGDGANAIPASSSYTGVGCFNDLGATYTITAVRCRSDNSGTSSNNPTTDAPVSLLTGALTCTPSWASGTLSGTPTVAQGHWLIFPITADGTTKTLTIEVTYTW